MENESFEGFIPAIRKYGAVVEYDPTKGITGEDLIDSMIAESKRPKRKPEYLLSILEAETYPVWFLNWLGENYIVLCSFEVSNIVKEREKNYKPFLDHRG